MGINRCAISPVRSGSSTTGRSYNFREIRQELKGLGYHFSSASDTEIILHAYRQWGTDCIHRFNGMFAFALYDSRNQKVWIVRDRYGIKPLYYTLTDEGTFLFGVPKLNPFWNIYPKGRT